MLMLGIAISVNGVEIRLTGERWQHITQQHPEMNSLQATVLNTVENPEKILAGRDGQLIAVRTIMPGKWLLVVYRELVSEGVIVDGFIVTAFFNRRSSYLEGKEQIWP
jgi:hypothetical protein